MDFLELKDKPVLIFGLANRKSVAWHVGQVLKDVGAEVIWVVRSAARRESVKKLVGDSPVFICDVESEEAMFGISLIMLFLAPIIYLLLSILALVSVGLKKYPTLVGALQLIYVILFLVFSSMGVVGDGDFELSAGGNFAGIGMYLIGFASIGYFIRK